MPTGVALRDPRTLLFDAAERVLLRDGPSLLTSRAVTAEAGVAKGVLHRHFVDFDAFLAELVLDRVAQLASRTERLHDAVGTATVPENLTDFLMSLFGPVAVAIVGLVITRDGLRARLRAAGAARIPLIAEGTAAIAAYLRAERDAGRVATGADVATIAPALVGAVQLLFTDREATMPDTDAVQRIVTTVIAGIL